MRLALLSLTAAAVATAAFAQDATAPAMPPPPPAAPPAAAAPAMPDPTMPTPAPAAPMDGMAMPAAPAAAPAADVPPPPPPQELAPMPTDELTLAIIDTLEKVCKPQTMGGKQDALAKADGFVSKKKLWTKVMTDKVSQIVIQPWSSANPQVCALTVNLPIDGGQTLANGLHAWASRQDPIMQAQNAYQVPPINGQKRTTLSWETKVVGPYTAMSVGLLKMADGKPVAKNADVAEVLFQYRPS